MFVAHAPASYLALRALEEVRGERLRALFWIGIIGSLFPDLDFLWFFLVDHQSKIHHTYPTHVPFYWALVALVGISLSLALKSRFAALAIAVFTGDAMLHLLLDTFVGGIQWLYPWNRRLYSFFSIDLPPRPVWFGYQLNWTIWIEAGILAATGVCWVRDRAGRGAPREPG